MRVLLWLLIFVPIGALSQIHPQDYIDANGSFKTFGGADFVPARVPIPLRSDSTTEGETIDGMIAALQGRWYQDRWEHPTWSFGPTADARVSFAFIVATGARLGWHIGLNDNMNAWGYPGIRLQGGLDISAFAARPEGKWRGQIYAAPYVEGLLVWNSSRHKTYQVGLSQTFPLQNEVVTIWMVSLGAVWPLEWDPYSIHYED